jgi:hypothetical protein
MHIHKQTESTKSDTYVFMQTDMHVRSHAKTYGASQSTFLHKHTNLQSEQNHVKDNSTWNNNIVHANDTSQPPWERYQKITLV